MRLKFWALAALALLQTTTSYAKDVFNQDGLILWLDANDASSVIKDDESEAVLYWKDKSGKGNDAIVESGSAGPRFIEQGINGKPSLRFNGKQSLRIEELEKESGELTMYVVYRRPKNLAGNGRWQRLVSSWDGSTKNDTKGPSYFLDTNGKGGELKSAISFNMFFKSFRGDMVIGKNMCSGEDRFYGEIAEIIAFNKSYYVNEPIQEVKDYLKAKWGIIEDTKNNWTLRGPMSSMPKRVTNDLPLIDQENKGDWKAYKPMWDEFNSSDLNAQQWFDFCPIWVGRAPGRFSSENVDISNGSLEVSMAKDPNLKPFTCYGDQKYHSFSSGSVVSKDLVLYGYFEIRARAMKSRGSSAWWFAAKVEDKETKEITWTEIDMFEIGGATPKKENSYNMNMHVFESPKTTGHHNRGNKYKVPYNLADEYHTYGLYWGADFIRYYIDGTLVRSVKNDYWHTPMMMFFDSETMVRWLGEPEDKNLPSTFAVDYVRAWKNEQTVGEWKHKYMFPDRETGKIIVDEVQQYILDKDF